MSETLKFGPGWLRSLSSDPSCGAPPAPVSKILADHRYGREEMLALFDKTILAPDPLHNISVLYVEKMQVPLAFVDVTEEETRMWNSNVNSDRYKSNVGGIQSMNIGGPSGGMMSRGRGIASPQRGRGRATSLHSRSYEDSNDGGLTNTTFRTRAFERNQGHPPVFERGWSDHNGNNDSSDWNGHSSQSENGLSTSPRKDFGTSLRLGSARDDTNWRRRPGKDDEDNWRAARPIEKSGRHHMYMNWREGSDRDRRNGEIKDRRWITRVSAIHSTSHSFTRNSESASEEALPEWANESPGDMRGTFDSKGAFHGTPGYSEEDEEKKQKSRARKKSKEQDNKTKDKIQDSHRKVSESFEDQVFVEEDMPEEKKGASIVRKRSAEDGRKQVNKDEAVAAKIKVQSANSEISGGIKIPKPEEVVKVEKKEGKNDNSLSQTIGATSVSASALSTESQNSVTINELNVPPMFGLKDIMRRTVARIGERFNVIVREDSSDSEYWSTVERLIEVIINDKHLANSNNDWCYIDVEGKEQGPFKEPDMLVWFIKGYFEHGNLRFYRPNDSTCHYSMLDLVTKDPANPFGSITLASNVTVASETPSVIQPTPQVAGASGITPSVDGATPGMTQHQLQQLYLQNILLREQQQQQQQHELLLNRLQTTDIWSSLKVQEQPEVTAYNEAQKSSQLLRQALLSGQQPPNQSALNSGYLQSTAASQISSVDPKIFALQKQLQDQQQNILSQQHNQNSYFAQNQLPPNLNQHFQQQKQQQQQLIHGQQSQLTPYTQNHLLQQLQPSHLSQQPQLVQHQQLLQNKLAHHLPSQLQAHVPSQILEQSHLNSQLQHLSQYSQQSLSQRDQLLMGAQKSIYPGAHLEQLKRETDTPGPPGVSGAAAAAAPPAPVYSHMPVQSVNLMQSYAVPSVYPTAQSAEPTSISEATQNLYKALNIASNSENKKPYWSAENEPANVGTTSTQFNAQQWLSQLGSASSSTGGSGLWTLDTVKDTSHMKTEREIIESLMLEQQKKKDEENIARVEEDNKNTISAEISAPPQEICSSTGVKQPSEQQKRVEKKVAKEAKKDTGKEQTEIFKKPAEKKVKKEISKEKKQDVKITKEAENEKAVEGKKGKNQAEKSTSQNQNEKKQNQKVKEQQQKEVEKKKQLSQVVEKNQKNQNQNEKKQQNQVIEKNQHEKKQQNQTNEKKKQPEKAKIEEESKKKEENQQKPKKAAAGKAQQKQPEQEEIDETEVWMVQRQRRKSEGKKDTVKQENAKQVENGDAWKLEQQKKEEEGLRKLMEHTLATSGANKQPKTQTSIAHSHSQQTAQQKENTTSKQQKKNQSEKENEGVTKGLKWAEKPVEPPVIKSLAEIQAEEQKRVAKQIEEERKMRAKREREEAAKKQAEQVEVKKPVWGGLASLTLGLGEKEKSKTEVSSPKQKNVAHKEVKKAIASSASSGSGEKQKAPKTQSSAPNSKQKEVVPSTSKEEMANVGKKVKNASAPVQTKNEKSSARPAPKQKLDELSTWSIKMLSNLVHPSLIDIPTFVGFLREVRTSVEIREYVHEYLGDTSDSQDFIQQFIERRIALQGPIEDFPGQSFISKKKNRQNQAANAPKVQSGKTQGKASTSGDAGKEDPKNESGDAGKAKNKKKHKMVPVTNNILGFNVTAASDRVNIGDLERVNAV